MINAAHAQGVRVVLCFTNFTSAEIDLIIGTPQYRTTFIQQALAIVQAGNGDGVNIDFEGINSSSKNALTQFMQALADSFHTRLPGSQVSCAPTDYDTRAGDWDLPVLYNAVDLFFFQGYGYGWSGSSTARPVGLLPNTSFWGSLNITTLIDFVLTKMPADKAVLGVPHYGRRWPTVSGEVKAATQGTGTAFYYPDALGYIATYGRLWEQSALNPWFRYQDGTQWYQGWYDDPQSMGHKYQLVLDRKLKGVGMWALGMDAGNHDIWDVLAQFFRAVSGVAAHASVPERLELRQNYPNPFNPATTIEYAVPRTGFVSLMVFNVLGQEMALLVHEEQPAGNHRVAFDAAGLPAGSYFAVLRAGGQRVMQKMLLVK